MESQGRRAGPRHKTNPRAFAGCGMSPESFCRGENLELQNNISEKLSKEILMELLLDITLEKGNPAQCGGEDEVLSECESGNTKKDRSFPLRILRKLIPEGSCPHAYLIYITFMNIYVI